jgi:hypothetical protein
MVDDHNMWQQTPHSKFMVPLFTPGNMDVIERRRNFHAHGVLLALHCYVLASGPSPVSIWFLLALCMGEKAFLIPSLDRYIAALDPVAFACLKPWFAFKPDDILPTNPMHPFNQFLITVMDIQVSPLSAAANIILNLLQPSFIHSPRSPTDHDGWTITFLAFVLLGNVGIWTHPEFLSMKSAFDIRVGTVQFVEVRSRLQASTFQH